MLCITGLWRKWVAHGGDTQANDGDPEWNGSQSEHQCHQGFRCVPGESDEGTLQENLRQWRRHSKGGKLIRQSFVILSFMRELFSIEYNLGLWGLMNCILHCVHSYFIIKTLIMIRNKSWIVVCWKWISARILYLKNVHKKMKSPFNRYHHFCFNNQIFLWITGSQYNQGIPSPDHAYTQELLWLSARLICFLRLWATITCYCCSHGYVYKHLSNS